MFLIWKKNVLVFFFFSFICQRNNLITFHRFSFAFSSCYIQLYKLYVMMNGVNRTLKCKKFLMTPRIHTFILLYFRWKIRFRATWQHAGSTWIAGSSGFSSISNSIETMGQFPLSLFPAFFKRLEGILSQEQLIETLENLNLLHHHSVKSKFSRPTTCAIFNIHPRFLLSFIRKRHENVTFIAPICQKI